MKAQRIEISTKTIVFTVSFLLGLWLLWFLRDIILLMFICVIFMEVLNPAISTLQNFKIPRFLSIIFIYTVVISFISFMLAWVIPILVSETSGLLRVLPDSLQNINIMGFSAIDLSSQFKILESIPANVAWTVISFFSNLFTGFLILVITFYLLIEREKLDDYTAMFFDSKGQDIVKSVFNKVEKRLGRWVNGELILMSVIGILSYLGYVSVGLNYALPLAIIAGLLEVVPTAGPIAATILAALVGLTTSPLTALFAVFWGIIVQQLENNFIVPKIMNAAVGLHPIITILVITIGAKFAGVGGALLAVPVYITFETIVRSILEWKKSASK
ncbi:MAG: AI-2E family transporter [Microgenomates group bacterium]